MDERKRTVLKLPDDVHKAIRVCAAEQGITMTDAVIQAIKDYIELKENEKKWNTQQN